MVALLSGNVLALVGVGAVLVAVVDACEFGVVLGSAWDFAGKLLEGLEDNELARRLRVVFEGKMLTLRLVSGMRRVVKIPSNMKRAKISRTWLSQGEVLVLVAPRVRRGAMAAWAMMEPTFPEAAEIPWQVDR